VSDPNRPDSPDGPDAAGEVDEDLDPTSGASPPEASDVSPDDADDLSVGDVLAQVTAERDEYLDALMRVKAEFDNHRKRVARDRDALTAQVSARLVGELLGVLDSCEAALAQGSTDVEPIARSLLDLLAKEGLEVMPAVDVAFDPHLHEAVVHEPGDGTGETVVAETLRTGYLWQGTVLRPAMVRVRG
jgi:molecular chaperone GrpE